MKKIKLSELKPNPINPRRPKSKTELLELGASIKGLEKMMKINKLKVDENNLIWGGNQRYYAMIAFGYKEIPESWIDKQLGDGTWTLEEKKEFMIKDNVHEIIWDDEFIENSDEWDEDKVEEWGHKTKTDPIEKIRSQYNDENVKYPIVPKFDEKYEAILIICENEIDTNKLRQLLELNDTHVSYKNSTTGKSNVIKCEKFIELWESK